MTTVIWVRGFWFCFCFLKLSCNLYTAKFTILKYSLISFDKCRQSCNDHHNQDIEHFVIPKGSLEPIRGQPPPHFQLLATTDYFSVPLILFFCRLSYTLWAQLLSLSIMYWRFPRVVACFSISCLFTALYGCTIICYPFSGWKTFGCFQFGVIINKSIINICVQFFEWTYIFISLE